jgi:hypothetical protein
MPRWRCLREACPDRGVWQITRTPQENNTKAAAHERKHQRDLTRYDPPASSTADDAHCLPGP